jgi:hypothetical protein
MHISTFFYDVIQASYRSTTRTYFLSASESREREVVATLIYHVASNVHSHPYLFPTPSLARAIEPELKPYPFYTTEERTAITSRTNRRVALFNPGANKKLTDREGGKGKAMETDRKRVRARAKAREKEREGGRGR